MAMRNENLSEKGFDQGPVISVAQFARIYPSWWNSNEPQGGHTLPKGGESKTKQAAAQLLQQAKDLGLQLPEQDSSSTKSAGQEMSFGGTANSHNQSMSSESGQDESCGRSGEVENRPFFLFSNSEIVFNGSQADQAHPMVGASYLPAGDPYFGGLLIQPQGSQGAGIATSPRVPLPLTFSEDGPIFVNAKQYNGILRRRQSRSKLEAQNKVVRTRKPYMHESRHRHALNRVRGSGGRFLSKQELQEQDPYQGSYVRPAADRGAVAPSGELAYDRVRDVIDGGKSSLALY